MSEDKYASIVTMNYVSVMNKETGTVTKIQANDANFEKARTLIREKRFDEVEKLSVKNLVNNFAAKSEELGTDFSVRIHGGRVLYRWKDQAEKELHNAMTERVIRMAEEGFDVKPLVNFMVNLLSNPSKTAVDELYLFLEATELPITTDGHLIAYKIVRDDYTSIHDPSFRNDVGTVVEMPRNEVCDDRNQTCSYGLHFCSKTYLGSYGSSNRGTDRLVLVKINPADVVSIPSDYNNAKGRASKYLIWKDITESDWRKKFTQSDYTDVPVESTDVPVDNQDESEESWVEVDDSDWGFNVTPVHNVTEVVCPECGSGEVHKKGTNELADGTKKQRYKCQYCGNPFSKVI